jgi:predicted ATPase/DNA-binding transcriptional regulator YiaG
MRPESDQNAISSAPPSWSRVLRALRTARGVTQDGFAAQLGYSQGTVRRWERGALVPDAAAEAALLRYCREKGLLRTFEAGPLHGLTVSAEWLQRLLAEARLASTGQAFAPAGPVTRSPTDRAAPSGAPPTNLPVTLTSFVGREAELAEVQRLLDAAHLVTLLGAGGVGKTRLAIEAGRALADRYPDGVWLIELAGLTTPALVPSTVATTLALRDVAGAADTATLVTALRSKGLLLVLDNCEHLVEACAALAGALLRACPRLRILATSRTALNIDGEVRLRVSSLLVPAQEHPGAAGGSAAVADLSRCEAVQLFVERAYAVRSDFTLSEANATAVAHICRRLDGIPLALELAAVRLAALSPAELAARLDDRFALLTHGSRTALPRHQTLRAALDWSHDLLSEPKRALFRQLAVFAGSFSLAAVEAVAITPGPRAPVAVLDRLAALVDQSLVLVDARQESGRYQLLETIRQYAAECLAAAGEGEALRQRHLAWYLALAERAAAALEGPRQAWWLTQLELDHDNLRTALGWAIDADDATAALRLTCALQRFWLVRGHGGEGARWLERVLARSEAAPARLRAVALQNAAELAARRGEYALSAVYQQQSLTLWRTLGDAVGVANALRGMGVAMAQQGLREQARTFFTEALAAFRAIGDDQGTASVLANLGLVATADNDPERATVLLEEALARYRTLGNTRGIANALDNLGYVALARQDVLRARASFAESMALFTELGDAAGLVRGLEGAAAVVAGRDAVAAARLLGGAQGLRAAIGVVRAPADQGIDEATLTTILATLAGNLVGQAWTEGHDLTPEQLHDLALSSLARSAQA